MGGGKGTGGTTINWINLESGFDRPNDTWACYTARVLKYYAGGVANYRRQRAKNVMDDYN